MTMTETVTHRLRDDPHHSLHRDLRDGLHRGLRDPHHDLHRGLRRGLRDGLHHDLHRGLRRGLRHDPHHSLHHDLRDGLHRGFHRDLHYGLHLMVHTRSSDLMITPPLHEFVGEGSARILGMIEKSCDPKMVLVIISSVNICQSCQWFGKKKFQK